MKSEELAISLLPPPPPPLPPFTSQCGRTEMHYSEMVTLHSKYAESGFEILAFPSNEFGEQVTCQSVYPLHQS